MFKYALSWMYLSLKAMTKLSKTSASGSMLDKERQIA